MDYFDDLGFVMANDSVQPSTTAYRRHRFDGYYGLQFIYEGSITLAAGSEPPVVHRAPLIFFTFPGVPFTYSGVRRQLYVCFRGPRAERYAQSGLLPASLPLKLLRPLECGELIRQCRELINFCMIPHPVHHGRAVLALEQILLKLSTQPAALRTGEEMTGAITALANRIGAAPDGEWDFAAEAGTLGISLVHFRRLFTALLGMPPHRYLVACRLARALRLLEGSRRSVKEIAFRCGYKSEFHFSRAFRALMKLSPREYRKQSARDMLPFNHHFNLQEIRKP